MTNALDGGTSSLPPAVFTTCRWSPEARPNNSSVRDIPLLDRHLDRLENAFMHFQNIANTCGSHVYQSWPGRDQVKQEIAAGVTARKDGDWRVRVTIHEDARVQVELIAMPQPSPPFRYDLPSAASVPVGAKVVAIDAEASCATPYVYEYKTVHREAYERALRRTKAKASALKLEEPFDCLLYFGSRTQGFITELTTSNIAIFIEGEGWVTPLFDATHPFLRGVMRQDLLDRGLLHERRITVQQWQQWAREGRPMIGMNGLRGTWDIRPTLLDAPGEE